MTNARHHIKNGLTTSEQATTTISDIFTISTTACATTENYTIQTLAIMLGSVKQTSVYIIIQNKHSQLVQSGISTNVVSRNTFYMHKIYNPFSCLHNESNLLYVIRETTVTASTYRAIFQTDQMQCLALNQCALSMFSHSHQSHSPISTITG